MPYYTVKDGVLSEIFPEKMSSSGMIQLETFPGILDYGHRTKDHSKLKLSETKFTVNWKQYGEDIWIDETEGIETFEIANAAGEAIYAPRVLSPQTDGVPVIPKKKPLQTSVYNGFFYFAHYL